MPAATLLTPAQRLAWLRLIRTEGIGPQSFRQLVNREGSAEAALEALPLLTRKVGLAARIPSRTEAEDEIAALAQRGGRLVASSEPGYPPLLAYIHGPPPLLSVIGGEALALDRTVGIVGARNASTAGQKMTHMLAGALGEAGFVVVSGLARGIDAAAHQASLRTGTVAVYAGGLAHTYPHENLPLADAIIEAGGMLLSEMPLGWEPRARDFPRRNRIVSGLSLGIVVVEAAKRSGSLITARLALEQNREVFAVPGSPLDPRAEGGNHLIRQGAHLVTAAADIIEALRGADPSRTPLLEPEHALFDLMSDRPISSGDLERLLQALSLTPVAVDDLIAATGLPASTVQALLLTLDLDERLEWSSGQLVALKP
jgi:DNA processing protein